MKAGWTGLTDSFRIMEWSMVAWLLCSTACTRAASEPRLAWRDLAGVKVIARITPGKPGAPSEVITVAKTDSGLSMTVERLKGSGASLGEERVDLPEAAFDRIWNEVEQQGIRSLALTPVKARAFDFGERRLCVEWQAKGSQAAEKHDLVWIQPLEGDPEKKVEAVFIVLNQLRREHAKKIALFYFPEK